MVFKNIKYLSVFLLFLLACNNTDKTKYDLTISIQHTYTLDKPDCFYNGTNLDTLENRIMQLVGKASYWSLKNNKHSDSCPLIPQKILIKCDGFMDIYELMKYHHTLAFTDIGITRFDIMVDTSLLHCIGKFSDRGSLTTEYGKKVDFDWKRQWSSLRILCDNDSVIFLFENDTLFKGNYYDLKQHSLFNNDYVKFTRYVKFIGNNVPVVVINAVYNTTMKNIIEIRNKFIYADQLYFQFGKTCGYTYKINDIYADTAILDSVLYFSKYPKAKLARNKSAK